MTTHQKQAKYPFSIIESCQMVLFSFTTDTLISGGSTVSQGFSMCCRGVDIQVTHVCTFQSFFSQITGPYGTKISRSVTWGVFNI